MSTEEKKKQLDRLFEATVTTGDSPEEHAQQLEELAGEIGIQAYMGHVIHAGRTHAGTFRVHFGVSRQGFGSDWPEWAFLSARDAQLNDRKLWVFATGDPFGSNLIQALVMRSKV